MDLVFQGSPEPTIGVEIEVQLIDPETRDLAPRSPELLNLCEARQLAHVTTELHQSMFEVNSGVARTVPECRQNIEKTFQELDPLVDHLGLKLAVSGTHPFQRWTERKFFPGERFLYLEEKFQWLARLMNIYGLHVHVGVRDGDRAMHIARSAAKYIPHLIALSASSPFWDQADTGMSSCRIGMIEAFPISGMPQPFAKWGQFTRYIETLHKSKAITSLKDIYWHIRPNPTFGTIEFRACDGLSTLSETMALVALIQALVVYLDGASLQATPTEVIQNSWIAPENVWRAARYGLDADVIVDEQEKPLRGEIEALLTLLHPVAEKLGGAKELAYLRTILKEGNGASRQREVFGREQHLVAVVDDLVGRFAADRSSAR